MLVEHLRCMFLPTFVEPSIPSIPDGFGDKLSLKFFREIILFMLLQIQCIALRILSKDKLMVILASKEVPFYLRS